MTILSDLAGINKQLRAKGIKEGDTVVIGETELQWSDDQSEGAPVRCVAGGEEAQRALLGMAPAAGLMLFSLSYCIVLWGCSKCRQRVGPGPLRGEGCVPIQT